MSGITIGNNISSLKAQRQLGKSSDALSTSFERLSSGQRINRSSDDAAGLAVSTSLKVDSRVFGQAIRNLNDGISFLAVASGALNEFANITGRQLELAEQAANGTYSTQQRLALNKEAEALTSEFNRVIQATKFNGISVFSGSLTEGVRFQGGVGINGSLNVALGEQLSRTVGAGSFQVTTTTTNGGNSDVIIGDFTNDGIVDVFTATAAVGSLRAGVGDGTFNLTSIAAIGVSNLIAGAGEDLSGDGNLDLIMTDAASGDLMIRLGNGNGTFKVVTSYDIGGSATRVEIRDFDGNGKLDILSVESGSDNAVLLRGVGDGTFTVGGTYSAGGSTDTAVGDVNGDGIVDLLVTSSTGNTFSVLFGNNNGSFKAPISFGGGTSPRDTELFDFNRDGKLDFAVNQATTQTLGIFFGNGDGTFSFNGAYDTGTPATKMRLADFNNDGLTDVISITTTLGGNGAAVFLANSDGTFKSKLVFSTPTGNIGINVADFNRDGVTDVFLTNNGGAQSQIVIQDTARSDEISYVNLLSQSGARAALSTLRDNLNRINLEVATIGAAESRVTVALRNLAVGKENTESAASRIVDVDVAEETSQLTRSKILQQAGSAILAQANQLPSLALQLLQ